MATGTQPRPTQRLWPRRRIHSHRLRGRWVAGRRLDNI